MNRGDLCHSHFPWPNVNTSATCDVNPFWALLWFRAWGFLRRRTAPISWRPPSFILATPPPNVPSPRANFTAAPPARKRRSSVLVQLPPSQPQRQLDRLRLCPAQSARSFWETDIYLAAMLSYETMQGIIGYCFYMTFGLVLLFKTWYFDSMQIRTSATICWKIDFKCICPSAHQHRPVPCFKGLCVYVTCNLDKFKSIRVPCYGLQPCRKSHFYFLFLPPLPPPSLCECDGY